MKKITVTLGCAALLLAAGCGSDNSSAAFYAPPRPASAPGSMAAATPGRPAAVQAQVPLPVTAYAPPAAHASIAPYTPIYSSAPAGSRTTRHVPVEIRQATPAGQPQPVQITTTRETDEWGRSIIVQKIDAPTLDLPPGCPGPMASSGKPGAPMWIGCGAPPPNATLPPVISQEDRQRLGVRRLNS